MVRLGAGVQEAARGRQEVRGWLSAGLVLRAARAARPSRACAAAAELIFFLPGQWPCGARHWRRHRRAFLHARGSPINLPPLALHPRTVPSALASPPDLSQSCRPRSPVPAHARGADALERRCGRTERQSCAASQHPVRSVPLAASTSGVPASFRQVLFGRAVHPCAREAWVPRYSTTTSALSLMVQAARASIGSASRRAAAMALALARPGQQATATPGPEARGRRS